MRPITVASLLSLTLLLAGCQGLLPTRDGQPLATSREAWEHRAPGCEGKDCALAANARLCGGLATRREAEYRQCIGEAS